MEFKNKLSLDIDIDSNNNQYTIKPILRLSIYQLIDNVWELKETLELDQTENIENINQIYLDAIEKLSTPITQKSEPYRGATPTDPDDIPF